GTGITPVILQQASDLVSFNHLLYFFSSTPSSPALYRSDGTKAGTLPVRTLAQRTPIGAMVAGDRLYFAAGSDSSGNTSLWTSDGTAAGTVDLLPSSAADTNPSNLTLAGTNVYFTATDASSIFQLW